MEMNHPTGDGLGIDGLDESYFNNDDSSLTGVQISIDPADFGTESAPALADPVEAPPVVAAKPVKTCCICGVDLCDKPRSHDHSGRLWCNFCAAFETGPEKSSGLVGCPDCGRQTRPLLMVDIKGHRNCKPCHQIYQDDCRDRLLHRATATADPEAEIHQEILAMVTVIGASAALALLVTLYHFHWLYFAPQSWMPFKSVLYFLGSTALGMVVAIGCEHVRIALRLHRRRAEYDQMIRSIANHILALDEDSHTMGISEPLEPLRRRVERAIVRLEAAAGRNVSDAADLVGSLGKKMDVNRLVDFLSSQRPGVTDMVARNREIATISYLHVDLPTTQAAVTAILLRLPQDQDALTRHALICFRTGQLEMAKKIFKRVVFIAREKNSDSDLAASYCNLGMLHVMLNEFDDAGVRYSQAMVIYTRMKREDGQADCYLNLGLIAFREKKWAEVETQLRKAMAINKRRNRAEGLAICCSLLGVILVEKEVPQLGEAKKLLNQAVRLNLELGRPGGVAAAYGNLGLVSFKRRNPAAATEFFLKAQAIYQRINRPKMTAKIQGMLKTVGMQTTGIKARI